MTRLVLVLLCLSLASIASAQTVILNPRSVEFSASADHATLVGGVPLVTKYELRHFLVGQTTPASVVDLGKPTPDPTGKIVATFPPLPLNQTLEYVARVVAVGSTGEGVSGPSPETYFFVGPPVPPTSVGVKK